MTQQTRIIIQTPVPLSGVRDLFDHCRHLLGAGPGHQWDDESSFLMPGNHALAMRRGQGLPARLEVIYGVDGHLVYIDDEDPMPDGYVEIYLVSDHGSSADLHAYLIDQSGSWLQARGYAWAWQFEDHDWQAGPGNLTKVGDPAAGKPAH